MAENIYPIFEKMLQRKDREALLKQKRHYDLVYRIVRFR